eukprot:g5541.t1
MKANLSFVLFSLLSFTTLAEFAHFEVSNELPSIVLISQNTDGYNDKRSQNKDKTNKDGTIFLSIPNALKRVLEQTEFNLGERPDVIAFSLQQIWRSEASIQSDLQKMVDDVFGKGEYKHMARKKKQSFFGAVLQTLTLGQANPMGGGVSINVFVKDSRNEEWYTPISPQTFGCKTTNGAYGTAVVGMETKTDNVYCFLSSYFPEIAMNGSECLRSVSESKLFVEDCDEFFWGVYFENDSLKLSGERDQKETETLFTNLVEEPPLDSFLTNGSKKLGEGANSNLHGNNYILQLVDRESTYDLVPGTYQRVVEGLFAYSVQCLLGIFALTALFLKRYLVVGPGCRFSCSANPDRTTLVWGLDVSKQAIGALFSHVCNIFLALTFAKIDLTEKLPQSLKGVRPGVAAVDADQFSEALREVKELSHHHRTRHTPHYIYEENKTAVSNFFLQVSSYLIGDKTIQSLSSQSYHHAKRMRDNYNSLQSSHHILTEDAAAAALAGSNSDASDSSHFNLKAKPDECAWYAINYVLDCGFGVPVAYVGLLFLAYLAKRFQWESLLNYGNYFVYGRKHLWRTWGIQLAAWLWIVATSKVVLALLMWPAGAILGRLGMRLFKPLQPHPKLELVVVMVGIPAILNVIVAWVYDNMLQEKKNENKVDGEEEEEEDVVDDDVNQYEKLLFGGGGGEIQQNEETEQEKTLFSKLRKREIREEQESGCLEGENTDFSMSGPD